MEIDDLDSNLDGDVKKQIFLTHMRNRHREPIYAMIGYAEMALEALLDLDSEVLFEDLKKVYVASQDVLAIVNGIFDPTSVTYDESGKMSEVFTRRIRHALRIPLNAIIGFLEHHIEVADPKLSKLVSTDLAQILSASHRVLHRIDDIITIAKMEIGQLDLDVNHRRMGMGINSIVSTFKDLKSESKRKGKILIVEESEFSRGLLARQLEFEGHKVIEAEDGVAGFRMLEKGGVDAVLLGVILPRLNGYQFLEKLGAYPSLKTVPVLMTSALDNEGMALKCIELGAVDFLHKPINPIVLKTRLGAAMERKWLRDQQQKYMKKIRTEKKKSDELLLNVLPKPIATRLKRGESVIADSYPDVSVLFVDLKNFTVLSSKLSPEELVHFLNDMFVLFDALCDKHGLEKIKTIGDCYMVVGGFFNQKVNHAKAMAEFALDMIQEYPNVVPAEYNILLRVGIHTGKAVAGVIGTKKFAFDIWGDTVNVASRMESHGEPGRVQVSEATYKAIKDDFEFEDRGEIEIKGKGMMRTYFILRRKEITPA